MVGSSVGAVVLIAIVAVLFAAAFVALWLRDKGRADEVSEDPERADPDVPTTRAREAREGAADEPPALRRERRH